MRFYILIITLGLLLPSCAPTIKVVAKYPSEQKKTEELVKGKGSSGRTVKRIEYYPNGAKKSEVDIKLSKKYGKYIGYHKNGATAVIGNYAGNQQSGKWIWTGMTGIIDSVHTYKIGVLNGKTIYYKDGEIHIQKKYTDGKLNGKFVEFYDNGNKKVTGSYLENLPHGQWLWRNEDKSKERLIHFRMGIKHGNIRVWNDGFLNLSGEFDNDLKTGTWQWYQSKKQLDSLATYTNGILDGEFKAWHHNFEPAVIGSFRQGNPHGEWRWWSENKTPDSLKTYSHGRLNGLVAFYYNNGQLKRSAYYQTDMLHGIAQSYFASGQIKTKISYQTGQKMGPYEKWSSSAIPEEMGSYAHDKLNGIVERWYTTGASASISMYDEGVLNGVMKVYSLSNVLKRELFYEKGKQTVRFEYHDNGRFKMVSILKDAEPIYERNWNALGVETTDEKYIVGTSLKSEFYLSGFLKYECTYKRGGKHGVEWWFDERHEPTQINIYYLGEKILSEDLLGNDETSK